MTSITWAGPRCVQEAAAILGPQNRTQGRCEYQIVKWQFGQQMHEVLNVYIGIETKFGDNI